MEEVTNMQSETNQNTFKQYLQDQGYSPADIELILSRVADYDRRVLTDCIFDSIEDGTLNLDELLENRPEPES